MVNTDFRREPVCILPIGFCFDDGRREKIWQRYNEKGAPLTRENLLGLFPEEPVLKLDRVKPGGVGSEKIVMATESHGIIFKSFRWSRNDTEIYTASNLSCPYLLLLTSHFLLLTS